MQVSIRELKSHLSKYLHLAQDGEDVVVTSHRKPIVSLASVTLPQGVVSVVEGVKWGRGKVQFSPLDIRPGKAVAEMVIEDRA